MEPNVSIQDAFWQPDLLINLKLNLFIDGDAISDAGAGLAPARGGYPKYGLTVSVRSYERG